MFSPKKILTQKTQHCLCFFFLPQNFYLIDKQLILFCGLVLVRRLVWTLVKRMILVVTPTAWAPSFVIVARSLNTFAILAGLLYLSANIVQNHPLVNMLYLTYP